MEHEVTAIACQQRVQEDRFTEAAEAPPPLEAANFDLPIGVSVGGSGGLEQPV